MFFFFFAECLALISIGFTVRKSWKSDSVSFRGLIRVQSGFQIDKDKIVVGILFGEICLLTGSVLRSGIRF